MSALIKSHYFKPLMSLERVGGGGGYLGKEVESRACPQGGLRHSACRQGETNSNTWSAGNQDVRQEVPHPEGHEAVGGFAEESPEEQGQCRS